MAFNAGSVVVTLDANTRPLRRDLRVAEQTVNRSAKDMSRNFGTAQAATRQLSRAARMLGPAVIAGVGVAVGAAGLGLLSRSIINIGAQFEQSMATVRGVMRASQKDFAALTSIAKQMGETTEWTASQAANALQFLGMAGFQAKEAIAALPGTLDLATAGQIELGRAADIASNALTAYQMQASELNRVNDIFVATITRSNTNIELMAESFKYAAPKAKAFGYDLETLAAMIGSLGNAGVQGSMAGTQLSFAMGQVDKAAKKLNLGSGAMLLDVLRAARDAGWDAAQMMSVFGERGGRAALVLAPLVNEVEELERQIRAAEGESKRLADTMRDTVQGRFKELKSVIEAVAIEAFTKKQSSLKDAIMSVTESIRENKDELEAVATAIVIAAEKIIKLIGLLATAAGKLVDLLGFVKQIGEELKGVSIEERRAGGAEVIRQRVEQINNEIKSLEEAQRKAAGLFDASVQINRLYKERAALLAELGKLEVKQTEESQKRRRLLEDIRSGAVVPREDEERFWSRSVRNIEERAKAAKEEAEKSMRALEAKTQEALLREAKFYEIEITPELKEDPVKLRETIEQMVRDLEKEAEKQTAEFELAKIAPPDTSAIARLNAELLKSQQGVVILTELEKELLEEAKQITEERRRQAELIAMQESTVRAEREQTSDTIMEMIQRENEEQEKLRAKAESVSNMMADSFSNAFVAAISGAESFKDAFKMMAVSILQDLTRMIIKQLVFNALMKAAGGIFGFESGGVVTAAPVTGMQHGGVIKKPTTFPLASVAEKGPEAVLPLANIGGELGVKATTENQMGAAGREVHIHFEQIKIESVDANSFMELTTRNPEAITTPIKNAITEGDSGLRSLLQEAMTG